MLSGPASVPRCPCYDYQGSLPAPFVRVRVWDRHFLHRILWQLLLRWEGFNRWDFSFKVKVKLSLCTPLRHIAGVQVSFTILIFIIRWRLLVSLVHYPLCHNESCPQYTLRRRLDGLQDAVWICRRRKKKSLLGIEPGFRGHPAHNPVAVLNVLQQISLCSAQNLINQIFSH